MEPDQITEIVGLTPTEVDTRQRSQSPPARLDLQPGEYCVWSFSTESICISRDINEHLRLLVRTFIPLRRRLEQIEPEPSMLVLAHWESLMCGCGPGPELEPDVIAGLAQMNIKLAFEILQTTTTEAEPDDDLGL